MTVVHHSAIVTTDLEAGLRFWRDGLGMSVVMDLAFDGDWVTLFGAPSRRLRSVMLGDPEVPQAGVVELVVFETAAPGPGVARPPVTGPFLLSLFVDYNEVVGRLASMGLAAGLREITQPGPGGGEVRMAVVEAPDGVLVELIAAS